MISAVEALKRLREGNRRFVDGVRHIETPASPEKRNDLLAGQAPFAVILACADSRVPVEHIFDQGFGDLFVIRVAGNIAAPSQIGSAEYAAQQLSTRLLVVLGHTRCGAVGATLESLRQPGGKLSENMASIVDRIRPAVEDLLKTEPECDPRYVAAPGSAGKRAQVSGRASTGVRNPQEAHGPGRPADRWGGVFPGNRGGRFLRRRTSLMRQGMRHRQTPPG